MTTTRKRSRSVDPATERDERDPRDLKPHERNARTHSAAQIAELRKSILEFGFTKPIVVDEDGVILAGHGAWQAACELANEGILDRVPVHMHAGLTEQQKRAYLIVDNRMGELSKWDKDKLLAELGDLGELTFDSLQPLDLFAKAKNDKPNITLGGDRFLLQVEMADEPSLSKLFEELRGRGLPCKILT